MVTDYCTGRLSMVAIAQKYATEGVKEHVVRAVLRRAEVVMRDPWETQRALLPDQEAAAVAMYRDDKLALRAIARKLGVSVTVLTHAFSRHEVQMRGASESRRVYPLRERAFKHARGEEAKYWLGFLLADGAVRGERAVRLALQPADYGHLKKLCRFLGCPERTVCRYETSCEVVFSSRPLVADLSSWGVSPRKSLTAVAEHGLDGHPAFWRGVIDGDGGVYEYKGYSSLVRLNSGSPALVAQYREFLAAQGFTSNERFSKGCHVVELGATESRLLAHLLYRDSNIHLDRKHAEAKRILTRWKMW